MATTTETYYDVLEIPPQASAEDVRSAYYRMVRRHPPEKDAAGFQRVQTAYEILGNVKARAEYDAALATDEVARELMEKAREFMEKGEPEEAIPLLKRAAARDARSALARDLLTQALFAADEFQEAEQCARKVVEMDPVNANYLVRLGEVLHAQDRESEALTYYRRAVETDPESPLGRIRLAQCFHRLDRSSEAVAVLWQGIEHDGRVDFEDFIYFQTLCRIYVMDENWDELRKVRARIRSVLPPDSETRTFVAWFYYTDAMQAAGVGLYDGAIELIEEAGSLDPTLPDFAAMKAHMVEGRDTVQQAVALRKDKGIEEITRMMVSLVALNQVLPNGEEFKKVFEGAWPALVQCLSSANFPLGGDLAAIDRKYPSVAKVAAEFIQHLRETYANCPKDAVFLKCPRCSDVSMGQIPRHLVGRARIDTSDLVGLVYHCGKCGMSYNGASRPPGVSGHGSSSSNSRPTSSTPARPNPDGANDPCFVVTAACGDASAPHVVALRRWRDDSLSRSEPGRAFIRVYRVIGPKLATAIEPWPRLKAMLDGVFRWMARFVE